MVTTTTINVFNHYPFASWTRCTRYGHGVMKGYQCGNHWAMSFSTLHRKLPSSQAITSITNHLPDSDDPRGSPDLILEPSQPNSALQPLGTGPSERTGLASAPWSSPAAPHRCLPWSADEHRPQLCGPGSGKPQGDRFATTSWEDQELQTMVKWCKMSSFQSLSRFAMSEYSRPFEHLCVGSRLWPNLLPLWRP